jgi:hypothetical protein
MEERNIQRHPSFGMIGFSRVSCRPGQLLFGSSIKPMSFIRMTITQGEKEYRYGNDFYFGHGVLAEVDLSPAQFAELLTNMNVGTGVPCTINFIDGKPVVKFKEEDETKETREVLKTIKERGGKITEPLEDLEIAIKNHISSGAIKKKHGEPLLGLLQSMKQEVNSNLPFYLEQLEESAEKVVLAKKAEMDAYYIHAITKLGIDKLQELMQIEDKT